MIGAEEINAVMRVMDRGILSGYRGSMGPWFYGGEEVKALEDEWAKYFGVKHAIACNSATSGLWLACAAAGLGVYPSCWQGEYLEYVPNEVIVTPYSMTCSASMPLNFGAIPIFADIETDFYCLDVKSVESKITEDTKAIIVVDLFGLPYDVDGINAIAKKHNIMVIEDAAQAIGAKYKGRYAGTLGDIGVYSLNVHKHIQCGEGGIVATDNDDLAFKIRLCMNHAEAVTNDLHRIKKENGTMVENWLHQDLFNLVGMNLRMTELSAAVAREQLKKLDGILKGYQEHAKKFNIPVRQGCTSAYYKYASLNMPENPNPKVFNMKDHYITPIYQMPLFRSKGYDKHLCPVCEKVEENIKLAWLKEAL